MAPPDYTAAAWYAGFYAEHFDMTFPGTDFVRDTAPVLALGGLQPAHDHHSARRLDQREHARSDRAHPAAALPLPPAQ